MSSTSSFLYHVSLLYHPFVFVWSQNDSKYFPSQKNTEVMELKTDLNSHDKNKVKDAVKKVIANMTVGKADVATLFTDVIKSMHTDNIELKKLVYLYIINYASSNPTQAILVVNIFQKDAANSNPLIRALAIRTLGCIRVDKITQFLCDPLSNALKDKDPYVRKTAAVCVAKLYDINSELVEEQGFLDQLRDLISDSNHSVVANAVAALSEISETRNKDVFKMNADMLYKLLASLNECSEWGQVYILDCLAKYVPDAKDAEDIIERVSPRLKHANSAVAMSAVKVIMNYLNVIENENLENLLLTQKLPPPLITLLSEPKPELQYVALRNVNIIVQKRPTILANCVKHFFCKYNDPIYVKLEKLEIMIGLASAKNIDKVLMEFKEYATEVDVEFVRKSVLAIGRCAIKLDSAAEACIKVLLELIKTKVNYVVQEAIIVIKDIFRKYPGKYESVIATLCENLDTLDEPDAKAAMVWIIGEYAERIDNAPELLDSFVDTFEDENPQVQLQLLTAVVKLFLKKPDQAKGMVSKVLEMATKNSDNPDLRDRGYVYWRLLSTDIVAAQKMVLAPKPVISDDTYTLDQSVLDILISNISSLSSVYHKPPEMFLKDAKGANGARAGSGDKDDEEEEEEAIGDGEEDEEEGEAEGGAVEEQKQQPAAVAAAAPVKKPAEIDLFGLGLGTVEPAKTTSTAGSSGAVSTGLDPLDFFNIGGGAGNNSIASTYTDKIILTADAGKGLQLRNSFSRENGAVNMNFTIENKSSQPLSTFLLKFNVNYMNLTPTGPIKVSAPVAPGASMKAQVALKLSAPELNDKAPKKNGFLHIAVKNELGVFVVEDTLPTYLLFEENGAVDKQVFLSGWKEFADSESQQVLGSALKYTNVEAAKERLRKGNVFLLVYKVNPQTQVPFFYCSASFRGQSVLLELQLNGDQSKITAKGANKLAAAAAAQAAVELLTS
jgi:vesicle coat complex subunit